MTDASALRRLRQEIDALDEHLFSVVARQMEIVGQIGEVKRQLGLARGDPVREAQLKARLKELTTGVLEPRHLEELSAVILHISRDLQAGEEGQTGH